MRIGIDGTAIWGNSLSGLTTYTVQIINSLLKIDDNNSYYIYCFKEVPEQLIARSPRVSFRVIRSCNRKIFQQTGLPVAALSDQLNLMFFPVNCASVFLPCKSVVTIHDLHPYILPEQFAKVHNSQIHGSSLRSTLNQIYWKTIMKVASKRTDRVIAVSNSTKKDIEEIFRIPAKKIDVVHEGVNRKHFNFHDDTIDLAFFREKYGLPRRYILCVGTHAYKNLEGAIRSFSLVKKKRQELLKLVISGNKQHVGQYVFQLLRDLNLEKDVIFTGFFPDQDLKYLYRCAELFLFPSVYEGFGLPVLEAFACGTPVVTSRRASLPEVAGEAGLLVNPDDPEDIASSILALLIDKGLREKKRQQGFEQVTKFSWKKAGQKTLEVFKKVI